LLSNATCTATPGLQVLAGDVEAAAVTHDRFMSVWRRYGVFPERFLYKDNALHPTVGIGLVAQVCSAAVESLNSVHLSRFEAKPVTFSKRANLLFL
jgi:hypothetical protein